MDDFQKSTIAHISEATKRSLSEILKTADNLIRRGQFEQAELCLTKAEQLDPKNIYAYAFKERIPILKEDAVRNSPSRKNTTDNPKRMAQEATPAIAVPREEDPLNSPKEPQKNLHPISKEQLLTAAKSFIQPEFRSTKAYLSEKPTIQQNNGSPLSSISSTTLSSLNGSSSEIRNEVEESRDEKIQRMVRSALEAARMRKETKSSNNRNTSSKADTTVTELLRSARQSDNGQTAELREALEVDLQERIREALRRRQQQASSEDSENTVAKESVELQGFHSQQPSSSVPDPLTETDRSETLARYKLVLASVWTDGAASEEEVNTLEQLRQLLSISPEEHNRFQKEVQMDTYVEAFKRAWNAGKISKKDVAVLAELRERFHISMEEHLAIESRILWEIQPEQRRPTLLVVDDDEKLLSVVTNTLNNAGFFTAAYTTSDEALSYLKESAPDLILCDVNLRTSSMGGFAFYERVRELNQLRDTPFIFLSGLTDETLVTAGKELGVDDYLRKPVSEDILLATIRGKLRRYSELKERAN